MRFLDLFSGIGGFALGLERAGHQTVAFCEIDPFCRAVLRKHWPAVSIYDDIRTFKAEHLAADGIVIDAICGGFPCQDISVAGKGAGINGDRSGLWSEYTRIISELRPRYVIVENVAALLGRGLERVLGDLAALRYDAEWHCIPASAVGAPHRRDRVWVVANTTWNVRSEQKKGGTKRKRIGAGGEPINLADSNKSRLEGRLRTSLQERLEERTFGPGDPRWIGSTWLTEPDVGRVAHGVPLRVDRLRSLGNAVVPQIAEIIGRAIND